MAPGRESYPRAEEEAGKDSDGRGHGEWFPEGCGLVTHVEPDARHEHPDAHRDDDGDTEHDLTDQVVLGSARLLD
jgi:hypothetical protein